MVQGSRNETGLLLLLLLGPLSRLTVYQFARVSTWAVASRRENVVSSIRWLSFEAKNRMTALPFLGEDLFNTDSFQQDLQEEVTSRGPWQNLSSGQ